MEQRFDKNPKIEPTSTLIVFGWVRDIMVCTIKEFNVTGFLSIQSVFLFACMYSMKWDGVYNFSHPM